MLTKLKSIIVNIAPVLKPITMQKYLIKNSCLNLKIKSIFRTKFGGRVSFNGLTISIIIGIRGEIYRVNDTTDNSTVKYKVLIKNSSTFTFFSKNEFFCDFSSFFFNFNLNYDLHKLSYI